ncbi:hypothetical protein [Alicyclobacillus herbarius]|uniref:hypothetical protein n=1 Tax=Alicyclobacillus herbarius TaxID=122960 RepID=UPI000402F438|nr:hypothetical protein [Alicyclobacillus herbarius]
MFAAVDDDAMEGSEDGMALYGPAKQLSYMMMRDHKQWLLSAFALQFMGHLPVAARRMHRLFTARIGRLRYNLETERPISRGLKDMKVRVQTTS